MPILLSPLKGRDPKAAVATSCDVRVSAVMSVVGDCISLSVSATFLCTYVFPLPLHFY